MNWISDNGVEFALLFSRLFLGILFLIQGYDKVFGIGINHVTKEFRLEYIHHKNIPRFAFPLLSAYSSFSELTGGILLITGLFIPAALLMLSIDLIIVIIGMGLKTPVWDMRFVLPRMILILFLWITLGMNDRFSLDAIL